MPIAYDGKLYEDEYALETGRPVEPPGDDKKQQATQVPSSDLNASAGSVEAPAGLPEARPRVYIDTSEKKDDTVYPEPYGLNPPERQTDFPRPRMTGIISGLWDSIQKASSLTQAPEWAMDPVTGDFHTSPQAIESAAELANLAVMGPAPMAAKLGADGTLGSFAGVRAKTLNKTELYKAQNLASDGVHPDDIFQQTGFFRSADGRWRHEIDDSASNINLGGVVGKTGLDNFTIDPQFIKQGRGDKIAVKPPRLDKLPSDEELLKLSPDQFTKTVSSITPKTLEDVLHHPELFKAYPHLRDITVLPEPKGSTNYGSYHPSKDTISIAELEPKQFHSTLMHEVQHAIQDYEGFVNGGNPQQFMSRELPQAEKELTKVVTEEIPKLMKEFGFEDNSQMGFLTHLIREEKKAPLIGGLKDAYEYWKKEKPEAFKRLENITNSTDLIQAHKDQAYEMYRRVMGEVEARNTQLRLDLSSNERRLRTPTQTQDYPNWQQIDPGQTQALSASAPPLVGELPSKGVVPANIGADGKIYVGTPNSSHFMLSEKYADTIRKEVNVPSGQSIWKGTGFINPEGKYMTREEAFKYVTENEKAIRASDNMAGELDALDYREQVPMKRRK